MRNKVLFFLVFGILVLYPQIALGDEIIVEYAEAVWDLTLDTATEVEPLIGEPGVMVTEYADAFVYYPLENATEVEPLIGEPGVMVTRYADTFMYKDLTAPPFEQYFDTGEGTYPSIMGTHNGTIEPSNTISVNTLYTYPCPGTGGHTEYVRIYNDTLTIAEQYWEGYQGDYNNITFTQQFTLIGGQTYNYTIKTGSYVQIIHEHEHEYEKATGGTITCTKFTDANGKVYDDWIPAIRLENKC